MVSVMISSDPTKYVLTKDRIEDGFYSGELDRIASKALELFKKDWCDYSGEIKEKEEVFHNKGHIVLVKEFEDFLSVYEENKLREYFNSCVEKAVRLIIEETFFDEC